RDLVVSPPVPGGETTDAGRLSDFPPLSVPGATGVVRQQLSLGAVAAGQLQTQSVAGSQLVRAGPEPGLPDDLPQLLPRSVASPLHRPEASGVQAQAAALADDVVGAATDGPEVPLLLIDAAAPPVLYMGAPVV